MVTTENLRRNGGAEGLTTRQVSVLPTLAGTRTITEAAQRSGVGRTTIHRWLQNPAFVAELAMWQQEVVERARLKLTNHMMHAVDVLGELLESEQDSVRRQAARDILTLVLHLEKHFEVVQRIEKVEEAVRLAEAVGVIK
jgi:transposase